MTCSTEISRRYSTREEAYGYLASRGFLFLPNGWENGLWAATIEQVNGQYIIKAWLRSAKAA
jgi:hypothetical protein